MADHVPEYLKTHDIAGEQLSFSLDEQTADLLGGIETGGRTARTLVKQGGASVVLMAMGAGNQVEPHSAPGVVTIQVLRGHVTIGHGDDSIEATDTTLLAFAPGTSHSLRAHEDSAVLITLSPPS